MAHKRKHRDKRTFATRTLTLTERVHAYTQVRPTWVTDDRISTRTIRVMGERRTAWGNV